jgi:hypothetical protein
MKRGLLVSLSLVALGWMAGCGGSGSIGSTTPPPNALDGQYAILLAGFDSSGTPVAIAGSLKADGQGHITAGEIDVNDKNVDSTSSSVTGSYSFDSAGSGSLGVINLSTTVGSFTPLSFAFSLQTSGDFGSIMSVDSNGFDAGGTMQQQTSAVFNLAGLAGNFVVTINGRNQSNPTSVLGSFTLPSSGAATNVSFDRSEAGTTTGSASATSATMSFAGSGPDTNGRGTFTLAITDAFGATNQTFTYYAITAKRIVALETDASGTMTADFASQTIPATPTTTGAIFGMAGVDSSSNEIAAVGQLQMTGLGPTAATLYWDSNDNGIIHSLTPLLSQAVAAYDSTTGRGTVTVAGGTSNGLADTLVFYLTATGAGFIMDATGNTTNRAMAGPLMAQATGPYSAATDLNNGLGIVRSRASAASDAYSLVGLFGITTNLTNYEILYDSQFGFGSNLMTSPQDSADSSIVLGNLDANVGRGTLSIQDTGSTEVFYIIGPNQFYFIDITGGANNPSTVSFVSPQ